MPRVNMFCIIASLAFIKISEICTYLTVTKYYTTGYVIYLSRFMVLLALSPCHIPNRPIKSRRAPVTAHKYKTVIIRLRDEADAFTHHWYSQYFSVNLDKSAKIHSSVFKKQYLLPRLGQRKTISCLHLEVTLNLYSCLRALVKLAYRTKKIIESISP